MSDRDRRIAMVVGRIYQCIGGLNVLGGVGIVLSWLSGRLASGVVAPTVSPLYPMLNAANVMARYSGPLGFFGILFGLAVLTASTAFLRLRPWGRRALIGISIFFMFFVVGWALFMASIAPRFPGLPTYVPKAFAFASAIVFFVPFDLAAHWLLSKPVKAMFQWGRQESPGGR